MIEFNAKILHFEIFVAFFHVVNGSPIFASTAQQNFNLLCFWQGVTTSVHSLPSTESLGCPAHSLLFLHQHIETFFVTGTSTYAKDKIEGWQRSQGLMEIWFQVLHELLWRCCCWTRIDCPRLSCCCTDAAKACHLWIVKIHWSFYWQHTTFSALHCRNWPWPICFNMQNMERIMQNMQRSMQNMKYVEYANKNIWAYA